MVSRDNVTGILNAQRIECTAFELPEERLPTLDSARFLGTRSELIFQAIAATLGKPGRSPLVLVSVDATVDLKKAAAAVDEKKVRLATERETEAVTGLPAGGISPLPLLCASFGVLINSSAWEQAEPHVCGGQRELNIRFHVADLVS